MTTAQRFRSTQVLLDAALGVVGPARVSVLDGLLSAIEPLQGGEPLAAGELDLGARLVTPALVNVHTHLALAALRGLAREPRVLRALGGGSPFLGNVVEELFFRLEPSFDAGDVRAFARMGAYECVLAGQAVVWDHYYHSEAVAEAMLDVGLAGVVAPTLQNVAGPGKDGWEDALLATERLATERRWADSGVFAAVGPHATDTVDDALFERARALAARLNVPLHVHLAQSHAEHARSVASHGVSPLTRLLQRGHLDGVPSALLVHALFVSDAELAQLHPDRDTLIACPHSQLRFCFPADLRRWARAGARWAIGTDAAACNDAMDVRSELRLVAGLGALAASFGEGARAHARDGTAASAAQLERERAEAVAEWEPETLPARLLSRVWSVPGALHPAFRTGVLAPGARADLAVWDTDHPAFWPAEPLHGLAFGAVGDALSALMVGGRWLPSADEPPRALLKTAEYRSALREARERLERRLSTL